MPAPTAVQVQNALKSALLAKGFTKKSYVNGDVVEDKTSLPDRLQTLVEALSMGDNSWFSQWQAAQSVVAVDSVTSAPVLGEGPSALP